MTAANKPGPIEITHAFSGMALVLKSYFAQFILIGLALFLPLIAIAGTVDGGYEVLSNVDVDGYWIYGFLVPVILMFVMSAPLSYASLAVLEGRRLSFGQLLFGSARFVIPVLIASLITTVLALTGIMLLFVPGLVIMTLLAVTIPAVIAEDIGPIHALKRSYQLVTGNAWRVFALIMCYFLPSLLFDSLLPEMDALYYALTIVGFDIIVMTFEAPLTAATYLLLVNARGGLANKDLATIFE